jgi:glycosyltransferase involved in cell wall biosynthesis
VPLEAEIGFVELPEFMASIAAADVIVCPYDRASQSGVLAVAAALGTPTVATDVGGLAELAGVSVPPDDVPALRRAIDQQLAEPQPGHGEDLDARALSAHLRAYARS